jgi:hypothetical protein
MPQQYRQYRAPEPSAISKFFSSLGSVVLAILVLAVLGVPMFFLFGGAIASGSSSELGGGPSERDDEQVYEPSQSEIDNAMRGPWDCYYDATMNENWHDDVTCTDGVDSIRPILLPDAGFVTETDMIAAGEAYEVELNR